MNSITEYGRLRRIPHPHPIHIYRLKCLNSQSHVAGTIREELRDVACLEEMSPWRCGVGSEVSRATGRVHQALYFRRAERDVVFQPLLPATCCLLPCPLHHHITLWNDNPSQTLFLHLSLLMVLYHNRKATNTQEQKHILKFWNFDFKRTFKNDCIDMFPAICLKRQKKWSLLSPRRSRWAIFVF